MTDPAPDCAPACMAMAIRGCEAPEARDPHPLFLRYLLAAFPMLVLDEPAHPVGTSFQGGDPVEQGDGRYRCPVREQPDDVDGALSRFCPACQAPGIG